MMEQYFNSLGWLYPKIQATTYVKEDAGKLEPFYTAGENVQWCFTLENSLRVPQNIKCTITI